MNIKVCVLPRCIVQKLPQRKEMESDAFVPSVLLDIAVWDVCVYHCSAGKHDHELLTVASTEN